MLFLFTALQQRSHIGNNLSQLRPSEAHAKNKANTVATRIA
jgi:hypothetical protein